MFFLQFMIQEKMLKIFIFFNFWAIKFHILPSTCSSVLVAKLRWPTCHNSRSRFRQNEIRNFYHLNKHPSVIQKRCHVGSDVSIWHSLRMTPAPDSANLFHYLFRVSDFTAFADWLYVLYAVSVFFLFISQS